MTKDSELPTKGGCDQEWTGTDSVCVTGIFPDDPDNIPLAAPNGFIWMIGGEWHGTYDRYAFIQARVSIEGETLDFEMTSDEAIALRELLDRAIQTSKKLTLDDDPPLSAASQSDAPAGGHLASEVTT
ncbi:hypothetical protein [Mameliella alba]|uniref:Uncharacterized protein n=1 Tax=Mameliella alba TaxID=561184 RepID=A0A0B3S157_9RHOB|nr:hypothetical protein [Mameliella alba]KHQ50351.1 hypothetical protein OA50_05026 [Mameliella alba]